MRSQFKYLSKWMGLVIPCALLLSACAPTAPIQSGASASTMTLEAARTITVVGQGEATAKPDIARMNLGIEASAPAVADALSQANKQMSAIITALKKAGIPDKDIRTSNFSINFEKPYQQPWPAVQPAQAPAPEPRGAGAKGAAASGLPMPVRPPEPPPGVFRVSNMVEVTVRDPSKAGPTLEAAVNAGANNVWNVTFALDNTKVVEAQAREKAVADARARAEELARLNGLHLADIVSVSTLVGSGPGPMPMMMSAKQADSAPPLEGGELTWSTQVQVVFAFTSK